MTETELKKRYADKGYDLVKGGGEHNYVLIPINNPHSLWSSFENLQSAEKALKTLDKPTEQVKKPIYTPNDKNNGFLSLKDEVKHCLETANIKALVYGAKKGEHHVKIICESKINGLVFDSGKHKISIGIASDMFGNKFYTGGRVRL